MPGETAPQNTHIGKFQRDRTTDRQGTAGKSGQVKIWEGDERRARNSNWVRTEVI